MASVPRALNARKFSADRDLTNRNQTTNRAVGAIRWRLPDLTLVELFDGSSVRLKARPAEVGL